MLKTTTTKATTLARNVMHAVSAKAAEITNRLLRAEEAGDEKIKRKIIAELEEEERISRMTRGDVWGRLNARKVSQLIAALPSYAQRPELPKSTPYDGIRQIEEEERKRRVKDVKGERIKKQVAFQVATLVAQRPVKPGKPEHSVQQSVSSVIESGKEVLKSMVDTTKNVTGNIVNLLSQKGSALYTQVVESFHGVEDRLDKTIAVEYITLLEEQERTRRMSEDDRVDRANARNMSRMITAKWTGTAFVPLPQDTYQLKVADLSKITDLEEKERQRRMHDHNWAKSAKSNAATLSRMLATQ